MGDLYLLASSSFLEITAGAELHPLILAFISDITSIFQSLIPSYSCR
jgi:hypothetical protein